MDPMLLKYAASIRVQATRTEMIDDLTEMFGVRMMIMHMNEHLLTSLSTDCLTDLQSEE